MRIAPLLMCCAAGLVLCACGNPAAPDRVEALERPVDRELLEEIVQALQAYDGAQTLQVGAMIRELQNADVEYAEHSFTAGSTQYNAADMTLTRILLQMPDEQAWLKVELVRNDEGDLQVQDVEEMRDYLATEPL